MISGDANRSYSASCHRDAEERQRKILRDQGWREAPGDRWINPRTGMVTDFRGALDREQLKGTFDRLTNHRRKRPAFQPA